jgi:hypothetical protein
MAGHLQTSSERDKILSVLFNGNGKDKAVPVKKTTGTSETSEKPKKPQTTISRQTKKKRHFKDTVEPHRESPLVVPPTELPVQDSYTQHAGFEENDVF